MRIQVETVNGAKEVIELVMPLSNFSEGDKLDSFRCGDGKEHYFTKDGLYYWFSEPRKVVSSVPATYDGKEGLVRYWSELRRIIDWFRPRCYCGVKIGWFASSCGKEKCEEEAAREQASGF
jgi:hypothetical protein